MGVITDPVADLLTRIRNAQRAGHEQVEIPGSKLKLEIVKILAQASWENGNDIASFQRDTFYVSLVPAQLARADLASRRLNGG